MDRPRTSKPRGFCQYFTHPRGCFAGKKCKFLHSSPEQLSSSDAVALTPYDLSKRCKFYVQGYCKKGEKCWFLHRDPSLAGPSAQEDELCGICLEKPVTFGLLEGCSHVFCLECIRQWRNGSGKGDITKKCPMCRIDSNFVIPSSKHWKQDDRGKGATIESYKTSMSKMPCKHFLESLRRDPRKPMCPFGKDCFYKHAKPDGSEHTFEDGVEKSMRMYSSRIRYPRNTLNGTYQFQVNIPIPGGSHENQADYATDLMRAFDEVSSSPEFISSPQTDTLQSADGAEQDTVDSNNLETLHYASGVVDANRALDIVASAVASLRAELDRMQSHPSILVEDNIRDRNRRRRRGRQPNRLMPLVVPGSLNPGSWDLDGMDGLGSNLSGASERGWDDLFTVETDAGTSDLSIMGRLNDLAGRMLTSLRTTIAAQTRENAEGLVASPTLYSDVESPDARPASSGDSDREGTPYSGNRGRHASTTISVSPEPCEFPLNLESELANYLPAVDAEPASCADSSSFERVEGIHSVVISGHASHPQEPRAESVGVGASSSDRFNTVVHRPATRPAEDNERDEPYEDNMTYSNTSEASSTALDPLEESCHATNGCGRSILVNEPIATTSRDASSCSPRVPLGSSAEQSDIQINECGEKRSSGGCFMTDGRGRVINVTGHSR